RQQKPHIMRSVRLSRRHLKFVSQCELHHTRLRQQASVISERLRELLQRSNASARLSSQTGEHVEAMQVGDIEHFPAELQAVAFLGQSPALVQCHVQPGVSVAADHVARPGLSRVGMRKTGERGCGVGKSANRAVRLPKGSGLYSGNLLRNALFIPVGRPEVAVIYAEGKSTGPTCYARKLPTADEGVGDCARVAREVTALAKRQICDPVCVDLMGGIKVRDPAPRSGRKSVSQAGPWCSHVCAGTEAQAGSGRRVINRLGVCVVEVELQSLAELLAQRGLERIVVRLADGAPCKHAGSLIVERS